MPTAYRLSAVPGGAAQDVHHISAYYVTPSGRRRVQVDLASGVTATADLDQIMVQP